MKYFFQFCRILIFCFLGELCARLLPFPVPASIYGLVLLLLALNTGLVKLEQVRETGLFLVGIFSLLFVPAAAGVMEFTQEIMAMPLPILIAIIPITMLVMGLAGRVTQALCRRKEGKANAER